MDSGTPLFAPGLLAAWLLPGLLAAAALAQLARAQAARSQAALSLAGLALVELLTLALYGDAPQTYFSLVLVAPGLAAATALLACAAGAPPRRWIVPAALSHLLSLPALLQAAGLALALPVQAGFLWQCGLLLRALLYLGAPLPRPAGPARPPALPGPDAAAPAGPVAAPQEWQAAIDAHRQASSLLAHELRAPLATLDTAAQALALAASEDDLHAHARLARMRRAVKRITELTDDFLGSGKLGERLLQPQCEAVDMQALAQGLAARMQADTAHVLRVEPGPPALAWADARLCAEALRNLLHNAVKYSPADQPILVRVAADARAARVAVSVSDRGPGISDAERERIFDPHYRRSIHRNTQGTGVGLYLSREMCRRQGGDLVLMRSGPDGSVFEIRLQAAKT
ncbi:HAMP domain-containing sensor histidine kinase [Orrella sp. JC864]|uniref:sensor histidine kinase n=1 Tax=Orrella sp. JC864 TaxID=3120298 RepID=UPI0030090F8B